MESLDGVGVVDGHDFGSGTFNIFVLTMSQRPRSRKPIR